MTGLLLARAEGMQIHRIIELAVLGAVVAGCMPEQAAPTPPVGKQLLSGTYTLRDMTSDGWIVYTDDDTLTMYAAPIAGGSAQEIVALADSFAISVWGKTVFVWAQ